MKKILFIAAPVLFTIITVQAQITPDANKTKIKGTAQPQLKVIKPVAEEPKAPPPPAPPSTTNKNNATTDQPAPVYTLTSARVTIRTGGDNKEFSSRVIIWLKTRNTPDGQASAYSQFKLSNEMRINSDTEIGLERNATGEAKLEAFQTYGASLGIMYSPNFFADAWKIESVSVVLEFKDQNGNLHPTFGSKTIVFNNAYGFLNDTYQLMVCETDGALSPLSALIRRP